VVGLLSGTISALSVIGGTGWILRGWVDEIEDLAMRIEQVDAAAVQRGLAVSADIAALKAELAAQEAAVGHHAAEAARAERDLDRRLTLFEERQRRVLRTLDVLQERYGLPPTSGRGDVGRAGNGGPP
jgi:hypothetical protein